jgi:hypothetical protein
MTITRKTIPVNEPTQADQASSINNISRAIELNGSTGLASSTEPVVDLSASTVSNLTRKLDVQLEAWRSRSLNEEVQISDCGCPLRGRLEPCIDLGTRS